MNQVATKVIYSAINEMDGVEVRVAEISSGFSVTLRDTDADEVVGIALIYPTAERAINKAKEVVA